MYFNVERRTSHVERRKRFHQQTKKIPTQGLASWLAAASPCRKSAAW
jgi:antibiotic biosynthesis monooxygenase (ABM) superfamily enzyme